MRRSKIDKSLSASNRLHIVMPALCITTSIPPKAFTLSVTSHSRSCPLVMSVGMASASPPAARHSCASESSRSRSRAASARHAPRAASARASARPIPSDAPVKTILRPFMRGPPAESATLRRLTSYVLPGAHIVGWLLRRFFRHWVRAAVQPPEQPASLTNPSTPVCYVLERDSIADLAVLCNATEKLRLPHPEKRSGSLPVEERRTFFDVGRRRHFWDATQVRRPPPHLLAVVEALRADPVRDVLLVPTAVYWGRAPQKEGSWLRLLFAENWALTTRAGKFVAVLINGRNVLVEMGEPISLRSMFDSSPPLAQARRVTRILRGVLRRQR